MIKHLILIVSIAAIPSAVSDQCGDSKCEIFDSDLPSLRACLTLEGCDPSTQLVTPTSHPTYYETLNRQWNTRHEKVYPIAYFVPTSTRHVQNIVRCGLAEGLPLVPNSGGHSYESLSFGTNSSLIVDFRAMNNVTLLDDGITAKLQPGAILAKIYADLWIAGKRSIPAGMCLTVGIGGNAIGGGVGYTDAVYGLASDNVIEFEMVTASGDCVTANEVINPDLYWALRGVGPGFIGIVTSLKMRTFDAGAMNITVARVLYPMHEFAQALLDIQEWIQWTKINDPHVLLVAAFGHDNYTSQFAFIVPGISMDIIHIQDADYNPTGSATFLSGVTQIFDKNSSKTAPKIIITIPPTFLDLLLSALYYTPVNFPLSNGTQVQIGYMANPILNQDPAYAYPPPGSNYAEIEAVHLKRLLALTKDMAVERFLKTKSFYVRRNLTLEEIQTVAEIAVKIPLNQAWMLANTETGRISEVGRNETAYVHRDVFWNFVINVESTPQYGDTLAAMGWLYELWEAGLSFDGGETYQNYPDLDLPDHFERNYAENFDKLVECKGKWDPGNYFNATYSIPISLPVE